MTFLTDRARYPAKNLAALNHERRELELGYDEVKTEILEREETLRGLARPCAAQPRDALLRFFGADRGG